MILTKRRWTFFVAASGGSAVVLGALSVAGLDSFHATARVQTGSQIQGRVTSQGRDVHGGIEISLDATPAAITETDGRFTIDGVPSGRHFIEARTAGYLCWQAQVTVSDGAPVVVPDVQLFGGDPIIDDRVNLFDLVLVTGNYGRSCPFPPESPVATAPMIPTLIVPTPAPPDEGGRVTVEREAVVAIRDHAFEPHAVFVEDGATVRFINLDGTRHIIVEPEGSFRADLAPSESADRSISGSETIRYVCEIHPDMEGVIVVVDPAEADAFFNARTIREYYRTGCGGCHGSEREGGIGPALVPGRLVDSDTHYFDIIRDGRPGTSMPSWGRGGLSDAEIWGLVGFLRSSPMDEALRWERDDIERSLSVYADEASLPDEPTHDGNLENLLLVTERESRSIALLDGDTHSTLGRIRAGFRSHGYTFDPTTDRWAYNVARDGWVYKIDLYTAQATRAIRVGLDSRGVAISDDGKTLLVGNYIPANVVLLDARSLEPKKIVRTQVTDAAGVTIDARVAATSDVAPELVGPYFVFALKEAGEVWRIDWSDPAFPVEVVKEVGRELHDGFLGPHQHLGP